MLCSRYYDSKFLRVRGCTQLKPQFIILYFEMLENFARKKHPVNVFRSIRIYVMIIEFANILCLFACNIDEYVGIAVESHLNKKTCILQLFVFFN